MAALYYAVKFIFKEEFFPEKSVRAIYYMAPVVALLPAALALAAIPFSIPIEIAPFEISIGSWSSGQLGPYVFAVQGLSA